jgi:hypothetical protein
MQRVLAPRFFGFKVLSDPETLLKFRVDAINLRVIYCNDDAQEHFLHCDRFRISTRINLHVETLCSLFRSIKWGGVSTKVSLSMYDWLHVRFMLQSSFGPRFATFQGAGGSADRQRSHLTIKAICMTITLCGVTFLPKHGGK